MNDQQLTSFKPYISPQWLYFGNCGYYVHRGTVYVVGEIGNFPGSATPGGPTILSGLPAAICPAAPTAVRVCYDWTNGSLPASTPPYSFATTVRPDGSWTFDSGLDTSQYLYFNLGMASWPTTAVTDDTFDWQDLTPHVQGPHWVNIDGQYALHDARLHLRGTIRNVDDTTGGHAPLQFPPTWSPPIIQDYINNVDIGSAGTQFPDNAGDQWVINVNNPSYAFINHNGYFTAGAVVDLTDMGWPLAYTPPPPPPTKLPSTIAAGPLSLGLLGASRGSGLGVGLPLSRKYDITALVYLAYSVGFGSNSAMAAAIAMAESGGDPAATNVNLGPPESIDRGLWQINNFYHPEVSDNCAFSPPCCGQAAYTISKGGTDWTPWSTYNNGAYQTYLPAAQAVTINAQTAQTLTPVASAAAGGGVASGLLRRPSVRR